MVRTHDPHFSTTLTTNTGYMHRSFTTLGSSTHVSTTRRHIHPPNCLAGPQAGPGHALTPAFSHGGHGLPSRQTPASTYVPIPYPVPQPRRMEIQGGGILLHLHISSDGHCPLVVGLLVSPGRRTPPRWVPPIIIAGYHYIYFVPNQPPPINLGEAIETTTTMFPHKELIASNVGTLPRHLWL